MLWRILRVLMWRHWLARKRQCCCLVKELLVPGLLFVPLWMSGNKPFSVQSTKLDVVLRHGVNLNLTSNMSILEPVCVLYTPETDFTQILMDLVAKKLRLERLRTLPDTGSDYKFLGCVPYTNSSMVFMYTFNMRPNEAVVIFHGITQPTYKGTPEHAMYHHVKTKAPPMHTRAGWLATHRNRNRNLVRVQGVIEYVTKKTVKSKIDWKDEAIKKAYGKCKFEPGVRPLDKLNYTISMQSPLFTSKLLRDSSAFKQPEKRFDASYEPFLRLQWAIDSSYIEMKTGKRVKQTVTLKEFPQARNVKFSIEQIIIAIIKAATVFITCIFAMISIFYKFMSRMLIEKASGIQELMKMMGVTFKALTISHVLNTIPPGLVYALVATALLTAKGTYAPVFEKCNGFLLFMSLFLHFFSLISLAMVCSHIGSRAQNTALTVLGVYLIFNMVGFVLHFAPITSTAAIYISGLLAIPGPLTWCLREAAILEYETGLNYSNMTSAHVIGTAPVLVAFIFFIIQIIIFFILHWYFDKTCSGYYGSALPWNFFCKRQYWRKTPIPTVEEPHDKNHDKNKHVHILDPLYYEAAPASLEAGIQIINVTKDYPKAKGVLNDLTVDVYKGEITVLLGENGAGKTTLMSIITGMTSATKGRVLVEGLDMVKEKEKARKHIGLCPQHNMFLANVNVIEHVMFFTLIKRGTFEEARKSAEILLDRLHILDKADNQTSQLSGGMKRRVQLACALAGDADVLMLDEPTSGLDVETRRSLWDLMLSFRGSHTVLLSTHFMEEADALGDRVIAISSGILRCHATPMFLKRGLGSGYRLTFTTTDKPNTEAIDKIIKGVIPEAELKETGFNSMTYNLPQKQTKNFHNLFSELESKKKELGITSIGVGVSTLEEVFLKLCSDKRPKPEVRVARKYPKLTGCRLRWRQLVVIVKRHFRYLWVNKISQIGFVLIIMALMLLSTAVSNNRDDRKPKAVEKFAISSPIPRSWILNKVNETDYDLSRLSYQYPGVHFTNVSNVTEAALRARQRGEKDYFAAIEVNDTDATVFYRNSFRHAGEVALNLLSNLLATRGLPRSRTEGPAIAAHSHPLPGAVRQGTKSFKQPKEEMFMYTWAWLIVFLLLTGLLGVCTLTFSEYRSGTRLNHILAGCSPELHWGGTLIASMLQVLITYIVIAVIACVSIDTDSTISVGSFLGPLCAVLLLGSMAVLAFSYDISFLHLSPNVTLGIVVGVDIFCMVVFPVIDKIVKQNWLKTVMTVVLPQYTLLRAMEECVNVAYLNALCNLNKNLCPAVEVLSEYFKGGKCCESNSNPVSYFSMDKAGIHMLYFAVQIFVFMVCVCLRQRCLWPRLWEQIMNMCYKPPVQRHNVGVVKKEHEYVMRTVDLPPEKIKDVMLVANVHKNYKGYCPCKSFNSVKGVSFSVKKGECFGLLGVNGAGKSTMFQMLTASHCTTRGRIFANGHRLKVPCHNKYMKSLSYCPQFFGIDGFLTGWQNLEILLVFHGLDVRDVQTAALAWIRLVDLEKFRDRQVSQYSGGMQRRIAAACALCTGAPLSLLDEPTAGVDVGSRRYVWTALKHALKEHRAIVITSHSLDEMESLCHRIAIMSAGEICALGSPATLKADHAVGHSVIFKLEHLTETDKKDHDEKDHDKKDHDKKDHDKKEHDKKDQVAKLKKKIEKTFKCTLKDEHKTMLHYHINETMQYSKLFQDMEEIQSSSSGLVEDYMVSETTLEEVFISFAKAEEKYREEQAAKEKAKKQGNKDGKPDGKIDGKSDSKSDGKSDGKSDDKSAGTSDGKPVDKKAASKSDKKAAGKSDDKSEDDDKPKKNTSKKNKHQRGGPV